jgi:AraC-like DNA-binding protein
VVNQIALRQAEVESPLVRRAYIAGHHENPVGLEEIAKAMHVSTFYFCKMFKRATGLTFTDYLGRIRVEKAKTLLLNPHLRISEIAYRVGFQSLTHFNRVFRKLTGESPTHFRANGTARTRPGKGSEAQNFAFQNLDANGLRRNRCLTLRVSRISFDPASREVRCKKVPQNDCNCRKSLKVGRLWDRYLITVRVGIGPASTEFCMQRLTKPIKHKGRKGMRR